MDMQTATLPASQVAPQGAAPSEAPTGAAAKLLWRVVPRLLSLVMSKRSKIGKSLDALPGRMEKVAKQSALVLEMVDDVRGGRSDLVPLRALVVGGMALLYTASPADLVPDTLPVLGSLDDLAVIALATQLVRRDLERYCELKGKNPRDYF